ncbi:FecR domain-containing protein [Bradymonas sediminis]|uniref:Uncharacterized protein n=1 Tax=Bradymonas sediminis TaxID=1548548 RepID=A0A2Z4FI34_9DELT|nr:FecR domain-containing protein [Bradymonas sediminis]AWV88657.1 hypothetical protein DN745_04610 [Bradymonas sediminis]TDP63658.1 FecR family protein [Bradymonas sediminis]
MKYWINSALICLALGTAAPAFAQESFVSYTVAPGDTCTSIAAKFYGDARAYNHIHDYNDLSKDGYACRPGMKLRLPVLPDQPEAQLMARTGEVRAKPPKAEWDPVDVGAGLFEAWRVNTLSRARAELGFRDESEIQMQENTLVVIYGPSKDKAERRIGRRAHVDKGRLKTALSGLSGAPMDVSTPDAKAEFKSGKAQVTVEDGESRIANHSGSAARVTAPDGSGAVSVKAGHGTRVKRGKRPEKPRPLPATPTWGDTFSPSALTFTGGSATVNATWNPVKNAEAFYVEISRGRRQLDVLFSKRVPATTQALQMQELPPGRYYVSIVAIDKSEFESIPSELRRLRVYQMGVNPSQIIDAKARTFLLGASFKAPRGMTCQVGDGAFEELVSLRKIGENKINCKDEEAQVEMTVQAVEPEVDILDASSFDVAVRRGDAKAVDLQFSPRLPSSVRLEGSEGVALKAEKLNETTMRLTISPREDAELGASKIGVFYEDTRLSALDLEVEPADAAAPTPTPVAPQVKPAEYLISAMLGYDVVGFDPYWGDDFPVPGASLEVGFGLVPTRYFAAEARVGMSLHSDATTELGFSARAQGMAGIFENVASPYIGIGAGWKHWLDNGSRFELRPSIGVMPKVGESMRLRAEVGADLTPVSSELRILPELRVGASWSF